MDIIFILLARFILTMKWTIRETNIFIGLGKRNNQTGILIDKTFVFIGFLTKSPISRLKSATFKTSKIGLNKSLFKKKKSAINTEFLKMVPLARIGLATPPLPRVCSTTEL